MTMVEIAKRNNVSERTIYRYKITFHDIIYFLILIFSFSYYFV